MLHFRHILYLYCGNTVFGNLVYICVYFFFTYLFIFQLQSVFDALCPVEFVRSRRRLCVVLVTQDDPAHDSSRAALREYAASDQSRGRDRVRYTYLFREKQVEFMNALTAGMYKVYLVQETKYYLNAKHSVLLFNCIRIAKVHCLN